MEPNGQAFSLKWLLFSAQGRLNRKPYWLFLLVLTLCDCLIFAIATIAPGLVIFLWVLIIPAIFVQIKRWHDRGKSGWFVLASFVPILCLWPFIELGFFRGTIGDNQYGKDPLPHQANNASQSATKTEMQKSEKYTSTASQAEQEVSRGIIDYELWAEASINVNGNESAQEAEYINVNGNESAQEAEYIRMGTKQMQKGGAGEAKSNKLQNWYHHDITVGQRKLLWIFSGLLVFLFGIGLIPLAFLLYLHLGKR